MVNFHLLELFKLTRLGSIPLTWRSCSSIHCVLLTKDVEPSNCFTFVIDAWAGFLFVTEHIKENKNNPWNGLSISGTCCLIHCICSWFAGIFSIMSQKVNTCHWLWQYKTSLSWTSYWKAHSLLSEWWYDAKQALYYTKLDVTWPFSV